MLNKYGLIRFGKFAVTTDKPTRQNRFPYSDDQRRCRSFSVGAGFTFYLHTPTHIYIRLANENKSFGKVAEG
jgi:hypothetical protein